MTGTDSQPADLVLAIQLAEGACVVRVETKDSRLVAEAADENLGLDDAVGLAAEFLASIFEGVHSLALRRTPALWARLWGKARGLLDDLTHGTSAAVREEFPGASGGPSRTLEVEIDRQGIEDLLRPLADRVMALVEQAMAGIERGRLAEVTVSGEVTLFPSLPARIAERTGRKVSAPPPQPLSPPTPQPLPAVPQSPSPPPLPAPTSPIDLLPAVLSPQEERLERLKPLLHPLDREDAEAIVLRLRSLRAAGDAEACESARSELDDLLFYVAR
jgi:hypothetical protein